MSTVISEEVLSVEVVKHKLGSSTRQDLSEADKKGWYFEGTVIPEMSGLTIA